MQQFKFHKSFYYILTLIIPQLFLGWIFYSAFETPDGNNFQWNSTAYLWIASICLSSILILLDIYTTLKNWILPVSIIVIYGVFLFDFMDSNIFLEIPRIKATSINYEVIPLYLTVLGMLHAMVDFILKRFHPSKQSGSNAINFSISVAIPLVMFLIVYLGGSIFRFTRLFPILLLKLIFGITLALFLFFFFRFILGIIINKDLTRRTPLLILFFSFLFPLIGLTLNISFPIFGDFNYVLIYVAVFVNSIGLILLLHEKPLFKFIGFLCASFGVPYVLYFFIVFVPYIPLSFIALLSFGAGILMLTPIVLLFLQFQIMTKQYLEIIKFKKPSIVIGSGITCILLLPLAYVLFCVHHKNYLHKVIDHTYHFDASNTSYEDFDIDKITYIFYQMEKDRRRRSLLDMQEKSLPLLSIYYNWYVFDNLQLSQQKTQEIKHLFSIDNTPSWRRYVPPTKLNAALTYTYKTTYVKEDDFYKTQLDLSITNLDSIGLREFNTKFVLPNDVFITDYYLDIEDRREYGILAERKAANWIYEQITNQNRDPGILQYETEELLSLRIFPFKANETRTSGFTMYHRNPIDFTMNDTAIHIDVPALSQQVTNLGSGAYYIPSHVKQQLPATNVPVKYYFLVDNTEKGTQERLQFKDDYSKLPQHVKNEAQVLYVDADINWHKPKDIKKSGFNLAKAIAQIQYAHKNQESIPFVIVYAPFGNRHNGMYTSLKLQELFPYDNLIEYSVWDKKLTNTIEVVSFSRDGNTAHFRKDKHPELISFDTIDAIDFDLSTNVYTKALQLHLFDKMSLLNPEKRRAYWLDGLRQSFSQNVLTHATTFISLETEAQKQRLLKKQEEIMNASYKEKSGVEVRRMSEPYFWILLIVFFGYVVRQQFLKSQKNRLS